jgi:hypothetical protein
MKPKIMNALYLSASFSYRVAILRFSLSRPMRRSTTFLLRYFSLLKSSASSGYSPFLSLRWGITGSPSRLLIKSRMSLLSYALSPAVALNRLRGLPRFPLMDTPSSNFSACVESCFWPPVISTQIGLPVPSQSTWIFVEKPPRLLPRACFSRLSSGVAPFFLCARRRFMRSNNAPIYGGKLEIDPIHLASLALQRIQNLLPDSHLAPPAKTVVRRAPGAIAFGKIAPGGARAQNPEYPVQNLLVGFVGTARFAGAFRRKIGGDQQILIIGQIITVHIQLL